MSEIRCAACGGYTHYGFEARDNVHNLPGRFAVNICTSCRSGITLPTVPEQDLGVYYPARYYTHEAPGSDGFVERFYHWRRLARLGLYGARRGNLLEIGPGNCRFLRFLRERGWKVTGLDPDACVVTAGQSMNIPMIQGTVPDLRDERFDIIIAWHSLEHSADPKRDARILLAHLRPGGRLIIGVPDFGSWAAKIFGPAWHNLDVPRHRVHLTRSGVREIANASRAKVCRVRTWLNPYSILESWNAQSGAALSEPFKRRVSLLLTPLAWICEAAGGGDCISADLVPIWD